MKKQKKAKVGIYLLSLVYLTLQNSKLHGYKQLHFKQNIMKARQFIRLGVLEGLGTVSPIEKAPEVQYTSICKFLPNQSNVTFVLLS